MKRNVALITMALGVLLVTVAPAAHSQNPPSQTAPIFDRTSDKVFEGQLTKVDTATKTITVRGMEDKVVKEMSFKYDDDTVIVGGDRTIQGLSGKTGSELRVSYKVERGTNQATRLELTEKQQ